MALSSPGVEIQVIDESFYTPAEPGTTPIIVVASGENKINGSGTAIASGTTTANIGKVFRITSQRELVETFGVPFFEKSLTGNPVHGGERNEYGLLAAYSMLGVTNSVFIMRAGIDLTELAPSVSEPVSVPGDGYYWIDIRASAYGIQEWNSNPATTTGGQKFTSKIPLLLGQNNTDQISSGAPKDSVGSIGSYAVVWDNVLDNDENFTSNNEFGRIWYKSPGGGFSGGVAVEPGQWVLVGSNDWCASWPTAQSRSAVASLNENDQFSINGNVVTVPGGANIVVQLTQLAFLINSLSTNTGVSAAVVKGRLYIYSDGATDSVGDSTRSGAIVLADVTGTPLTDLDIDEGTYLAPKLEHAPHTQRPLFRRTEQSASVVGYPLGSVWLKTTEPNQGARLRVKRWNSDLADWEPVEAPLYRNNHSAIFEYDKTGGLQIPLDSLYAQFNASEHYSYATTATPEDTPDANLETTEIRIWRRIAVSETRIVSQIIDTDTPTITGGAKTFTIKQSITGSNKLSKPTTVTINKAGGLPPDAEYIAGRINAATFVDENDEDITNNVQATFTEDGEVIITHRTGGDIRLSDVTGTVIQTLFPVYSLADGSGTLNFYALSGGMVTGADDQFLASNWRPLAADEYAAQTSQPSGDREEGLLWYNPNFGEVDIMYHNGNTWVGYRHSTAFPSSDPLGPQVSVLAPETQSDGTALVDGDLWISTADLENFPIIYRWNGLSLEWVEIDTTDQTTEDGVLFADARYNTSGATGGTAGTIQALLTSNFIDPDAPDPDLYPKGILLYNTRRSGGNVKRWLNIINTAEDNTRFDSTNSPNGAAIVAGESMSTYNSLRWVTASPNNEDGSGSFGRKAQRSVVVQAMKSVVDTSEEARDEERRNFNLIAAPGYPELLSNLVNLNLDRSVTAFVVGDTPLRLRADATSLTNWGTNARLVLDNGDDGIVTFDEYCAVFYPNGFTTDLSGSNAVVPASHMMLRTIALSDQVSYPWFAPAGTRRGGITNATAVGFIDTATGEFTTVALNTGQRDTLYDLKVNPIPFFVGVGLVAYGQKTRARNASALDRINVARLIIYLRRQLAALARPYIFEPNDQITRDEIKAAVESLLIELVGLRAIYDFAVVCDDSNNTPSRVDRNELYIDIAIEPTKAIEFIYIPLRIKNTGEI
jgi:hypothetical protein